MTDVLDRAILMVVPVIHFLVDVALVLLELTNRVRFNLLDLVSLALQLCVELLDELTLLLEALLLLLHDSLLDLG